MEKFNVVLYREYSFGGLYFHQEMTAFPAKCSNSRARTDDFYIATQHTELSLKYKPTDSLLLLNRTVMGVYFTYTVYALTIVFTLYSICYSEVTLNYYFSSTLQSESSIVLKTLQGIYNTKVIFFSEIS